MGQEDKSMNIAGCGCLLGLFIGFILFVALIFSGSMVRGFAGVLILIPLLGLFCGSVPMTILSPDKGLRFGAGCICYPLLIFVILGMSFDRHRIAWEGFVLLGILVLASIIAGAVRKHRGEQ